MIKSMYLGKLFKSEERNKIIDRVSRHINELNLCFDTVVFTGNSGSLIVPEIAIKLNKPFTLVRKEKNSHSCLDIEGYWNFFKYLIIDDCVESGKTIERIVNIENKNMNFTSKLIGIYTYNQHIWPHSIEIGDEQIDIYSKNPEEIP